MIKPEDIKDMIFRTDNVDGVTTVYMMETPPKGLLLAQEMLSADSKFIYVDLRGYVCISVKNASAVYKLSMNQLQKNAMTLERLDYAWRWTPPPPAPGEKEGTRQ